MDRAHLGELPQRSDEPVRALEVARRGHELHQRLARVPPLPHDEVPQIAGVRLLVERRQAFLLGPVAHSLSNRVPEVGREPAAVDLEHLVPPPCAMEPERRTARRRRERVLELVPVVELLLGREDRLERRLGDPADSPQRVTDLRLLRGDLGLVAEILEAAAAAPFVVVLARRVRALRAGDEHLRRGRLGEPALHLGHLGANGVAGQPPANENDEAVQPGNAVAAVGEGVDLELELVAP